MARRKRHGVEAILLKLREADRYLGEGLSVGQICQRLEVSEATLHRWRGQYGGLKAQDMKRLKALEEENRRLKRLVADLSLDKQMLEELSRGNF